MTSIAIVNIDVPAIQHAEVVKAAAALQRQVIEHFFPIWGRIANVRAPSTDEPIRPDEWVVELRRVPDGPGYLGQHGLTDNGLPYMIVLPELDVADGVEWTVTASHEILETLADEHLRRATQDDSGVFWALEVCDAVEQDWYLIDGVAVSNFVTPVWGEPPANRAGLRYDYLGFCTGPWEVRVGGYAQRWERTGWSQVGLARSGRFKRSKWLPCRAARRGAKQF